MQKYLQFSTLRNGKTGYTLIEVLVAITIIGILFGAGYANFRSFSQRQTVLDAAKNLQGDVRLAQSMALAGQKPTTVTCNSLDGVRIGITPPSNYRLRAQCGGQPSYIYKEVVLPSGITITAGATNPILFKVLGQGTNIPAGQSSTITLTQSGTNNKASVTVSSGGQIQ